MASPSAWYLLLSVLILPLPTLLLDLGLALSITAAVLVLMVALFLNRPLDFSSFPTLLLLTTLLRLSLNVAVTRLILSHGNEGPLAAGHVVAAFGGFLMGGDVVIGLIIFSIRLSVPQSSDSARPCDHAGTHPCASHWGLPSFWQAQPSFQPFPMPA